MTKDFKELLRSEENIPERIGEYYFDWKKDENDFVSSDMQVKYTVTLQ